MKCVVGIDLGSTTTKAILLDEEGLILGRGITNSRSNYEVAYNIAREEALASARFAILEQKLAASSKNGDGMGVLSEALKQAFRHELYLGELESLRQVIMNSFVSFAQNNDNKMFKVVVDSVLDEMRVTSGKLFEDADARKSDFFRDIAGAEFMTLAERISKEHKVSFDKLISLFDRAIIGVETQSQSMSFATALQKATMRLLANKKMSDFGANVQSTLAQIALEVAEMPIDEMAFVGTGYGRQTLPFPAKAVRSEILCHGRGAHRFFASTRTVLDIGGQDTKAIQVDKNGVVTSFQMNDRCAAGCGRYLGYIADELKLGLHELGPLALEAKKIIKVNSTCTVFAGAELRERLALGEDRRDILAGLHRAIIMRAMSLLARSGGIKNEFTFTGGVCKNQMAVKMLKDLVAENYGDKIKINTHADSIYTGALGAALFALDDLRKGEPNLLPHTEKKPCLHIVDKSKNCESCSSSGECC